ncbi:glutamate racemase [bacterium]|nr:glutamate racemase [bacterium]MBU1753814.1 glutamate racemase [bacterium]
MNKNAAIGIFDSGVGGLTVMAEIIKALPCEEMIYFGDLARTPYGSKSKETVVKFSCEIVQFLISQGVKAIVVACNTASASALEELRQKFSLPIIGVILPGAQKAAEVTQTKRIGVIATRSTIATGAYVKAIQSHDPQIHVISQPCPLFVPLVEEGWLNHVVTKEIAKEYLFSLKANKIDTIILGCTHYPFLRSVIQDIMGNEVTLINSAEETARVTKEILFCAGLLCTMSQDKRHRFYVSDEGSRFIELGEQFLKEKIRIITQIDLGKGNPYV